MFSRLIQSLFLALIHAYRFALSPFLGGQCRYTPTCSTFGLDAIREWGPWRGGWMTLCRIARCHPWARGGYDPIPAKSPPRKTSDTARTDA